MGKQQHLNGTHTLNVVEENEMDRKIKDRFVQIIAYIQQLGEVDPSSEQGKIIHGLKVNDYLTFNISTKSGGDLSIYSDKLVDTTVSYNFKTPLSAKKIETKDTINTVDTDFSDRLEISELFEGLFSTIQKKYNIDNQINEGISNALKNQITILAIPNHFLTLLNYNKKLFFVFL